MDRQAELRAALDAVRAAARVCIAVQQRLVTAETLEKKDRSPVTVADFASQAIVCARLAASLPGVEIVGEEDAGELRAAGHESIRAAVVEHVRGEVAGPVDAERVLDWIDMGGADASSDRYWTVDPIDGTKGFLRGEQYAVALALIEGGAVTLGVLGCPNLPFGAERGALFAAVRGQRARLFSLSDEQDRDGQEISVAAPASPAAARLCESVEGAHSDQSESARIAQRLGITGEPYRIDSQCKYGAVARGDASIYLRMPTSEEYREKVWDHAAGKIIVECAGGRVTDVTGAPLDFTQGRTLERNRGVIATSGAIHDAVIDAIRWVRGHSA